MLSSPGVILGDFQDQGDDGPPPAPQSFPLLSPLPFSTPSSLHSHSLTSDLATTHYGSTFKALI